MTRIGLAYVKGSVPGFEHFGNLPTDIVKENGLVNGNKASDELDALIIPGGTLIESNDINMDLNSEIKKMARDGRPIIGICAGFQLLSNQIDIGRKSEVPIIKEGLGLESAFKELSQTINNALNDEIKRALLETSFGRPFDESLMEIANKNNSDNLKHTFQLIIHSWNSGGNLSEILEAIADDLSDTIMLKKQRKAGVMMSVMFLIISSVIATPFAFGMIQLYTQFISISGRTNPLSEVIPISSTGYIIIQAILVSILLGIVMYSDAKKGIKYMIIIVPASLAVYYFSQQILTGIMGGII